MVVAPQTSSWEPMGGSQWCFRLPVACGWRLVGEGKYGDEREEILSDLKFCGIWRRAKEVYSTDFLKKKSI